MLNNTDNPWPKWNKVYELWTSLDVPEIEISPFEIGKHYAELPWVSKKDAHKMLAWSNALLNTARHIGVCLKDGNKELKAAYKLNAFCVEHDMSLFQVHVLEKGFAKFNKSTDSWWHPNVKHVLPYTDGYHFISDSHDWEKIVQSAAQQWTMISDEWRLIIIPDFMDSDSEEYEQYLNYCDQDYEKKERKEYERLKRKFETA